MQRVLYRVIRTSLLLGCLLLSLASQSHANEQKILILGDSISAAYGMSLEQGWVALLSEYLKAQDPTISVVNASISGETTSGGVRRLPPLLQEHQPDIVVIELGANDGLRGFPLATLQNHLTQLADMSQQSGAKVVLVSMEIPPNYGTRYTSGFRESFQQVAQDTESTLAPFIMENVATDPQLMQDDGIHPTVAAQPILLENILPTLLTVLKNT